jgi:protease IV
MSQNVTRANPPKPVKKMKGWVIALIVTGIILGVMLIFGFIMMISMFSMLGKSSTPSSYVGRDGYVAVLHIEGTISSTSTSSSLFSAGSSYNQKYLLATVEQLKSDSTNKGIFLFIDSPGGEVYATDELYLALEDYKDTTGRPIYAYCASMAASGGYYLACSADKILMNRNCMTGSIGVTAGTYIDISGFLEKQGIKTTSIYVGKNKTMGSYFEGFTDEQKKIYTDILMETYDQFVQVVADGRGLTTEQVTALADGRIYSPKQALADKLADGIMTEKEAKAAMTKDNKLGDGVSYVDYSPSTEVTLSDLLGLLTAAKQTELDSYLAAIKMPVNGPAYYYEGM